MINRLKNKFEKKMHRCSHEFDIFEPVTKSLEKFIDVPMKEFCVNIYKKIYLFVQLMQQYLSE